MTAIMFSFIAWIGFTLIGCIFIKQVINYINFWMLISAASCVGGLIYISILRILSEVTNNFKISVVTSLTIVAVLVFLNIKILKSIYNEYAKRIKRYFVIVFTASIVLTIVRTVWMLGSAYGDAGVYAHWGATHAGRYVNFGYDIFVNNRIPTLGQSYGQSMLVALGLIFGIEQGFMLLSCYVSLFIGTGMVFTYGFLNNFNNDKFNHKYSPFIVIAIFFANTYLTLTHMITVDGGWPLLYMGYVDLFLGLISVVYIFLKVSLIIANDIKLLTMDLLEIMIISFALNTVGAHFFILFIAVQLCLLTIILIKKTKFSIMKKLIIVIFASTIAFLIGILFGGLLTPGRLIDAVTFEGMMNVESANNSLAFYLPFVMSYKDQYPFVNAYVNDIKNIENMMSFYFYVESSLLESIKVMFWPLSGLVGCIIIDRKKSIFSENNKWMLLQGSLVFMIGYIITFCLSIYQKGAMMRFMLPGYYIGLVFIMILLEKYAEIRIGRIKIYLQTIILILITFGSLMDLILTTKLLLRQFNGVFGLINRIIYIYSLPASHFYG